MKRMRNTPKAISAACALVDAAKRDLERYGDEQRHAIENMIEICLVNLKPAVGDLWCLMCAMDESENDYSLQLENLNYHYRIGQEVLDELTSLIKR
jgi:hypothetical protein